MILIAKDGQVQVGVTTTTTEYKNLTLPAYFKYKSQPSGSLSLNIYRKIISEKEMICLSGGNCRPSIQVTHVFMDSSYEECAKEEYEQCYKETLEILKNL